MGIKQNWVANGDNDKGDKAMKPVRIISFCSLITNDFDSNVY